MNSVPFMFASRPDNMELNKDNPLHTQARQSSDVQSPDYFESQSPLIPLYDLNVQILSRDMDKLDQSHSSNSGRPRAQEHRQDTSHTFGQNIKESLG